MTILWLEVRDGQSINFVDGGLINQYYSLWRNTGFTAGLIWNFIRHTSSSACLRMSSLIIWEKAQRKLGQCKPVYSNCGWNHQPNTCPDAEGHSRQCAEGTAQGLGKLATVSSGLGSRVQGLPTFGLAADEGTAPQPSGGWFPARRSVRQSARHILRADDLGIIVLSPRLGSLKNICFHRWRIKEFGIWNQNI